MRFVSEIGMIRMSMLVGLSIIFIMALTGVFLAAPAQAATISCGQCHGAYINNLDGTTTLISGTSPFEDVNTPQADNIAGGIGRGLHGIHMNYSSASYGKASGRTTRGNCSYCHNSYVHQSGFVTFSGMSPTARQKTGSTGVNGKVSGTGTGPNGMDITLIDGTASCSAACHKGTSAASPALWGNYTSPSIRLSCASCHDDVSTKDAAGFSLSGAHKQHLQSVITVNGGSLMGAAGNAGCVNCHPDNTGEGKLSLKKPDGTWSDDGSKKAYPHASDGTHVVFDNASVIAKVAATKAGLNTTCTGSCHNNTTIAKWGDSSLACDACHYYADPPTHDANEAATVKLSGSHSSHFSTGTITCSNCHTVPATGDTSHAHSLPPVPQNATLLASLNWNGTSMTCTDGTCHVSASPVWGTTATCLQCHGTGGVATQISGRDIQAEFGRASHHISGSWASVTTTDCAACHAEGNYADGSRSLLHTGASGKPVYLKKWTGAFPTAGNNGTFSVISTSALARNAGNTYVVTPFCLGCHNETNANSAPFHDGNSPETYAWDGNSIDSKYSNVSTTPWGKFNSSQYNVVPADTVTKSFSPHGNAGQNRMNKSLTAFATYSATSDVQCYDCHNSHGSTVTGGTSYTSANTAGGIIKTTATYTPAAGGSAATKNAYSASADLCFDCHLGESGTGEPKNYRSFGIPSGKAIVGYYDRVGISNFNNYSTSRWSTSDVWRGSFAYKDANFAGGHFGNSRGYTQMTGFGTRVNGNCTACHDPHGVSPAIKRGYTKPVQTVTHATTTGSVTLSNTYTGAANASYIYVVQIVAGGAKGTATYRASSNGGKTWTPTSGGTNTNTAYSNNGITATFNTGNYVVNDTWTWLAGANPNYMVPALKGTWMHSPYKEDRAPRKDYTTLKSPGGTETSARLASYPKANDYTDAQTALNPATWFTAIRLWDDSVGGTSNTTANRQIGGPAPRGNPDFRTGSYVPGYNIPAIQGDGFGHGPIRDYGFTNNTSYKGWNGFFIDENTFGTYAVKSYGTSLGFRSMTGANPAALPGNFAGLCLKCHVWAKNSGIALSNVTSANLATGANRVQTKPHETVLGMGTISVDLYRRTVNAGGSQQIANWGMHQLDYNSNNSAAQYGGPVGPVNNVGSTDPTANGGTNGGRMHYYRWGVTGTQTASGTIQGTYHRFPCSKCHTPHVSRLPRLMKTNCLDNDNVGSAHTTMAYVTNGTTLDSTTTKIWGALARNSACHSTKIGSVNYGTNSYYPGGWNNKTPW